MMFEAAKRSQITCCFGMSGFKSACLLLAMFSCGWAVSKGKLPSRNPTPQLKGTLTNLSGLSKTANWQRHFTFAFPVAKPRGSVGFHSSSSSFAKWHLPAPLLGVL